MKVHFLVWVTAAVAFSQTAIDLTTQSKNVDFSSAISTKAFKTGASLPPVCKPGETFFLTSAAPGTNFFGCTAVNVWSVQQGSAQQQAAVLDFPVTRTVPSALSIGAGSFRFGSNVYTLPAGSMTAGAGASGTVRVYATVSGQVVAGHRMGAGALTITGAGYLQNSASDTYPAGSIPLFECTVSAGVFSDTCTNKRATLDSDGAIQSGASGIVSVDCAAGQGCVVDALPAVVATKVGANSFTGMNTFEHLRIPSGPALVSTACDETIEEGKLFYLSTAPSGYRLYVCEGTTGWKPAR